MAGTFSLSEPTIEPPSHTFPQYPPLLQPQVVQALAPDDSSIAIDSCDSDREIDCDADGLASFEALDEAEHIGVDTQDWD